MPMNIIYLPQEALEMGDEKYLRWLRRGLVAARDELRKEKSITAGLQEAINEFDEAQERSIFNQATLWNSISK